MKKLLFFLFTFFIAAFCAKAQNNHPVEYWLEHLKTAPTDSNKVTLLLVIGDEYTTKQPLKAVDYFNQALSVAQQIKMPLFKAYCYERLGIVYQYSLSKYDSAEVFFLECLKIRKEILGKKNYEYSGSLLFLGQLYFKEGDYEKARTLLMEVREINKVIFEENDINNVLSLISLAKVYAAEGNYSAAEPIYLDAIQIIEEANDNSYPYYIPTLICLSDLYRAMDNFDAALPLCIKARDISKQIAGVQSILYSTSTGNLAVIYDAKGTYNVAEQLYIESCNITKEIRGVKHPEYASSIDNLAGLYKKTGNYAAAEPLLIEAKNIRKEVFGDKNLSYATSLNNLAGLYNLMGNYSTAEPLVIEAKNIIKEVLGEKNPDYATALCTLAEIYSARGNYTAAEPLLQEAKNIREVVYGKKHSDYASSLNSLAILYQHLGNYTAAELMLTEAMNINKEVFGEKHSSYASALISLASFYYAIGNYTASVPLLIIAKKIVKEVSGEKTPIYLSTLNYLALSYYALYKDNEAWLAYKESIEIINSTLLQNFSFLSEKEKGIYLSTFTVAIANFYSFALQQKQVNPEITKTVYNSVIANKGLLLTSSKAMQANILNSKDTALISRYEMWIRLKNEISKLYSTEISKRISDPVILEQQANVLEKELVRGSQVFGDYSSLMNLKWEDVKSKLKSNEAVIEFVRINLSRNDSAIYAALILRPEYKQPVMISLFVEGRLQKLINKQNSVSSDFIAGLYSRGIKPLNENVIFSGDSLYTMIWKSILPYLQGAKTIYYAPAGMLHQIAFSAIPNDNDSLLSDIYDLRCVSSTSVLIQNKDSKEKPKAITLFGGIAYDVDSTELKKLAFQYQLKNKNQLAFTRSYNLDDSRGSSWNYLPNTLSEVQAIKLLSETKNISTTMYSGSNASEEVFKSFSGSASPDVIHVATHGFFFPDIVKKENLSADASVYQMNEDPLFRSGLLLAGANYAWKGKPISGVEDGILTAYEVSNLNLRNTKLVVLSACETGLGEIKGSEGVYGLQRAFKMAGVKYIIMSLWQVPDKETAEFMKIFYNNWFASGNIRKSFTETQRTMSKKYAPYYWAAFVLIE